MNWKLNAVKALKATGLVLVGGIVAGVLAVLGGPDLHTALDTLADSAAGSVPVLGSVLLAPALKTLLYAAVAGVATSLANAWKHWEDAPAPPPPSQP
jgi:hypothetical protein